jgi:hypothetical protein
MSVDKLRSSRDKATVVFVEFTRLYKQYESALFCFFEGEDSKYYGIRIKNITRPEKDIYFSCKGKEGVLGIYKMLSSRKSYENARKAYFIDRDFDQSIAEKNIKEIYETPCYSIENFYTSVKCFSEILKSEFKLAETDQSFINCISLYTNLQKEFHDAVELLNTWIACQRNRSSILNISDLNVQRLVTIDLTKITINYTTSDLQNIFPSLPPISQMELDSKKSEFLASNRQKSFRGKFEAEFLYVFLNKLMNEANQGSYPYFNQKVKVNLHFSRRTIISDLSQYADTPNCLYEYLESLNLSS